MARYDGVNGGGRERESRYGGGSARLCAEEYLRSTSGEGFM